MNKLSNRELLDELYSLYKDFKKTSLYIEGATSIVFGDGNYCSNVVLIGEAPGLEEDRQAKPFVGRSGKLLTKAIELSGYKRENLFITNIVKCRPPENRTPTLEEIKIGKNLILKHEIKIISPKIIVPLGLSALKGLCPEINSISGFRGREINSEYGKIFPIFHPSYVLRNRAIEYIFFSDIKNVLDKYL
jgi:uracil-DNA glycosylase family 4